MIWLYVLIAAAWIVPSLGLLFVAAGMTLSRGFHRRVMHLLLIDG